MKLTYCNPLPLPNYQPGRWHKLRPGYTGASFREMADPTVIRWQGRWYLFPSAGLLWHSDDMVNWEHHPIEPVDPGYAPTVVEHGEYLYLSTSWDGSAIWRAKHPLGPWERLGTFGHDADNNPTWLKDENGEPVRWGDPCLFSDNGALYCYCNQARPSDPGARYKLTSCDGEIFGVRLRDDDPTRFAEKAVKLFQFNPDHVWERMGEFNQNLHTHILEGPWMNKINGRYYLQYSANGTEFTNYAIGCYTGNKPLGPFTYQKRNPILIHRGGLVNGCAHHSVVEGPNDTYWCFYTTLVGIDYRFERRIGMDPVGFDENGEMFVAGPTETPQFAPGLVSDPAKNDNSPGLIPLSVHTHATASSSAPGRDPSYAVNNHIRTWWEAERSDTPQWLQVDLDFSYEVHAARILFADRGLDYAAGVLPGPYRYVIEGSLDGKEWTMLFDHSKNAVDRHIAYHTFPAQKVRYVRLTVLSAPPGMRIAVWEFTVFGLPG